MLCNKLTKKTPLRSRISDRAYRREEEGVAGPPVVGLTNLARSDYPRCFMNGIAYATTSDGPPEQWVLR